MDRAAERAQQGHPDVRIAVDIVPDDAEAALLREARRATAVVTGCRGRGPITGALLGSVSRSLSTRAARRWKVAGQPGPTGAGGRRRAHRSTRAVIRQGRQRVTAVRSWASQAVGPAAATPAPTANRKADRENVLARDRTTE
ncbi:universal stress protein [Streptomyces mexicanus]|uniref:universal stress protein n=1 Tax=Streptomyces mexicanus TaxID=178566 RepID=UPI0036662049